MVFVCMSATVAVAHRFSTSNLPERERVSRWREEFARGLVQVDLEPLSADDRPFHQEANVLILPGVGMVESSGSLARYDRTRALAANGGGMVGMIVNLEGKAAASQFGRDVTLVPGDAVACTPYEPGVLTCTGQLGLVFPRAAIAARVHDIESMAMRVIPRESEPLRLLKRYLMLVRSEVVLGLDSPDVHQTVAGHIHELVALAINPSRHTRHSALSAVAAARLAQAVADIARNFTDPGLSLTVLAHRQRVSARYLQRLFETSGVSFTSRVQELRLQRASELLTQSNFPPRRISDIALEVGFADVSHFNRLFRTRFGETPTAARGYGRTS
jgi:AraC-like DNA-binding protein